MRDFEFYGFTAGGDIAAVHAGARGIARIRIAVTLKGGGLLKEAVLDVAAAPQGKEFRAVMEGVEEAYNRNFVFNAYFAGGTEHKFLRSFRVKRGKAGAWRALPLALFDYGGRVILYVGGGHRGYGACFFDVTGAAPYALYEFCALYAYAAQNLMPTYFGGKGTPLPYDARGVMGGGLCLSTNAYSDFVDGGYLINPCANCKNYAGK